MPAAPTIPVAVQVVDIVMPRFRLMHEMTTDHVHEEIQLLANDFSTMLFETTYHLPSFAGYYKSHDQGPSYAYLKRSLKALHEVAALALGGGLAACLVINLAFQGGPPESFVAARTALSGMPERMPLSIMKR